jgi:AcrR family transcriptional regulator
MASSPRRVGPETSKTREVLLDCVERLMLDHGYASVTYRALAAKAGVTPSLVQYYFPTLDDIFVSTIQRRRDKDLQRLADALQAHPDEPLHVIWEFSLDEGTGALMTEFMALGNHRKSIRAEIAEVSERVRQVELHALRTNRDLADGNLSPAALALLIGAIPKFLNLEKGIGVHTAHHEVVDAVERYLDSLEPTTRPRRRKRSPPR